jgi:hypothetical protein
MLRLWLYLPYHLSYSIILLVQYTIITPPLSTEALLPISDIIPPSNGRKYGAQQRHYEPQQIGFQYDIS